MTAKEAQSEAPSVDDLKMEIEKRVHIAMIHARNTKQEPSIIPMLQDTTNIIMAKINRLITEARIDELKQLLGRQWWADDQHHEDEVVPYHHIEAQIKLLSNNLSKGDV